MGKINSCEGGLFSVEKKNLLHILKIDGTVLKWILKNMQVWVLWNARKEILSFHFSFPCYWHLHGCLLMLTLIDKSLLEMVYCLSKESALEALQRFWTEKKMKKGSGAIAPARLISITWRFEEMECLQNWPQSGKPRLSEVCTPSVVLHMNTLREQPMSGVPVPVYSGQELAWKQVYLRHQYFALFIVCYNCIPVN